ncbi:MAG TPA: nucleotidyltransferase family protein [Gemmatimonadaceae bacterium]
MIVGILLAAGGATRFGSQKLVAPFRGAPLIRHAAIRLRTVADQVIAVVGNDAEVVRTVLDGGGLTIVENPDWATGLSSSLKCGVAAAPPETAAVIVALGDQPEIEIDLMRSLITAWEITGMPIVTARYRGLRAPPVLLAREVFADVAELSGDIGAKALMERFPGRISHIDVDAPIPYDVDTREDLAERDR